MPDILADGRFGEDHGWTCPDCGGATYLSDDQGRGLMGYNCEQCERVFQVQYEWDDPDEDAEDNFWEPPDYYEAQL